MRQMVGDVFRRMGDVGQEQAVGRRSRISRGAQHASDGEGLGDRANAANARRDRQRILGRPPDEDLLEATIERRRHEGLPHGSRVDIERDLQIAFDAIERSDDDPAHLVLLRGGNRRQFDAIRA